MSTSIKPPHKSNQEYRCDYGSCTKLYRTKFSLERHYLSHLGIKQHQCPHCHKRFALPQYLAEHIFTHTGEKPFICPFPGCTKRFRQAGKLSIHKKRHNLVDFSDSSSASATTFGDSSCTLEHVQAVLTQINNFELPAFFYHKTLPLPGPSANLGPVMPQLQRDYRLHQERLAVCGNLKCFQGL